jgi:hypothetical protein
LTEKEYEELKHILLNKTPEDYGFSSKVWNGQIITDLIKQKFDVNYRKANIYIMLKKKLKLINRKSFGVMELK